jgi:hypothetical protein
MASKQSSSYSQKSNGQWRHVDVYGYEMDKQYFSVGISQHMMNRKDWFVSFSEAKSTTKSFTLGKGWIHAVEQVGDVQLQLTSDKKLIFKNVLYVLGLSRNLFFVSWIGEQSLHVEVVFTARNA